MSEAPDPLVQAEVDLRDFGFMPLDVLRLRDSDLAALANGEEFKAAVLLWCAAWHQVPAASLPNDDRLLARFSGAGPLWRKVKAEALRGFVECSDGRLYHSTIAEKALEAWRSKQAQRARTAAATAAREARRRAEHEAIEAQRHVGRNDQRHVERDVPRNDERDDERHVVQGTVKGQEQGIEERNTAGLRPAVDDDPSPTDARPTLTLVEPRPGLPDCPHQDLIALYRRHLPHLRQPVRWDGDRAEAMRTRWRECSQPTAFGDGYATKADGLVFWDRFFAFVAATPKLRDGITSREGGQVRVWKPDLPWLVVRSNFTKVIEGAFE